MKKLPQDNLHSASRLAGDLPGILLEAERVAHTFMRGIHGRRKTGQGETFWQFRSYQQGDSASDIDWRQTAKRDAPFVRELEWEASQTVWMYRDATASMDYRSSTALRTKKDYAEILLMALSMVILSGGEQVGLLGTDLRPQTHDRAIERLYEYLPRQIEMVETGRAVSSGGQVVLISDFYTPVEEIKAFCASLAARRISGVLVQVCDPAEETLPFSGRVRFQDTEHTGLSQMVPEVAAIRDAYQARFRQHRDDIAAAVRGWGWHFVPTRTDIKPEEVLTQLHHIMSTRKQG